MTSAMTRLRYRKWTNVLKQMASVSNRVWTSKVPRAPICCLLVCSFITCVGQVPLRHNTRNPKQQSKEHRGVSRRVRSPRMVRPCFFVFTFRVCFQLIISLLYSSTTAKTMTRSRSLSNEPLHRRTRLPDDRTNESYVANPVRPVKLEQQTST